MNKITESSATIHASTGPISKQLDIFYNPVMKFNRDMSIILLNALQRKNMRIADPLAGSGIRAIRFLKEVNKGIIDSIDINDNSKESVKAIKRNLKLNNIRSKVAVSNQDANLFLLNSTGFDYIDVDPFGSPNPFLDSAIKRIARDGILAVTATDTAPLCGTYTNACKRKYWAIPLRNELMHEVGIRILIRKVQLIGVQYDKALTPILSFSKDHYFRIFFQTEKSKTACDSIVKQHHEFAYCPKCFTHEIKINNHCSNCKNSILTAGPLWTGNLHDKKVLTKMQTQDYETKKFLDILKQESQHDILGFHDLHKLSRITKKAPPKTQDVITQLKKQGYIATQTHFSLHAVKTNAPMKEFTQSSFSHQ
jgi:tRNA (guanine26-N2/guanine27-N2)-dimethyltransferase